MSGAAISIGASPADGRSIGVWSALLSEDYNFTQSRSFPLFVALSIRWLVHEQDFPAFVAVGVPMPGPAGAWQDSGGRVHDPAGADFRPPLADEYRDTSGNLLAASLLDPWTTRGGSAVHPERSETLTAVPGGGDVATWIMVLALSLLLFEWFLFRSGRIP